MQKKRKVIGALGLLFFYVAGAVETTRMGFADFFKAAQTEGYQLGEGQAKLEYSQAREDFALSKATPNLSLEILSGPTPGAKGNAVDGSIDWSRWGAFVTAKSELIQPIYTFGALSEARVAARSGTIAEEALLEKEKWALHTQVGEIYYGFQLAFEFSGVAEDFEKKLEKALQLAQSRKIKRNDLEKIKSALTEAKIRRMEAEKGIEVARAAMAWKIGTYPQMTVKWDRANLEARSFPKLNMNEVLETARKLRPEIKALEMEVQAKRALAESEEAQNYPALFLAGKASYGNTPVRDVQKSPFANDPFNTLSGGAALGLKWNLSFWERSAKSAQARAEARQAENKFRHLQPALVLETEKLFREMEHNLAALNLRKEASRSTKLLFQDITIAYGLGTGSAKDFLEAAGNFALAEKSRLDAVYNFNISTLKLEQALGRSMSETY